MIGQAGVVQEPAAPAPAGVAATRQLLVDVSVVAAHDAGTGIQRVVRAVLAELQRMRLDGIAVRLVAASAEHGYRVLNDDFLSAGQPLSFDGRPEVVAGPGDIFLGLDLSAVMLRRHEPQLAAWRAAGASIHVVVYDLLPILHPRWFRWRTRRNFRRWLAVVERNAHHVICISRSVARDFQRWNERLRLRRRPKVRVSTLTLGGDIEASTPSKGIPADAEDVLAWMRRRPTVLMVGTIEPRKAYDRAVAAFQCLWRGSDAAPQLLVVGRPGWKTERLQRRMLELSGGGDFLWLSDASDEYLNILYQAAAGVLFATRREGFGLPLVEALASRRRVLARDHDALREIATSAVTFFKDDSPAALADAVEQWLEAALSTDEGEQEQSPRLWAQTGRDLLALLGLSADHS